MMAENTIPNGQTLNVAVTRVLHAPVEQVWKAWSEPEFVKQWWGPTGFTAPSAEMDFREGGTSLVYMRAPAAYGGQDMYTTWTYHKIVPDQEIEFILHFSDPHKNPLDPAHLGMEPGIPNGVLHRITFTRIEDNRTLMTVTEYGYTTQQAHDLSKAGLEQCLDKMEAMYR